VPKLADTGYDLKLGRDWFNYCKMSVPSAQIMLSDDMCLVLSSSPFFAVRARKTMATSLFSGLDDWEMSDISDHLLSCDADVAGSGATSSHNSHDQEMSDISDPLLSYDVDTNPP